MKRRSFLKTSAIAAGATLTTSTISANAIEPAQKDFYELKVFQLARGNGADQLKKYYENAVIPLLNSRGAKVGVFREYSQEDPPRLYILHAFKSSADYFATIQDMKTKTTFIEAAREYTNTSADKPVFERYETFMAEAFDAIPRFEMPAKNRGLFEFRIYESYNEDAGHRKVKMFNKEELSLFQELGLHPVFFGQLLAGQYMPALAYMLWFKDMDERNTKWDIFRKSEAWSTMKVKPEYSNTVSKVRKKFLLPVDFSQI